MSKLRKLVLTVAALAALAVGGAAFAQAQNAGSAATTITHRSVGESSPPGDTDAVQGADQGESDQGQVGEQESGSEGTAEAADSASAKDSPDAPGDHPDAPGDHESPND
jgi:hypothetical protein